MIQLRILSLTKHNLNAAITLKPIKPTKEIYVNKRSYIVLQILSNKTTLKAIRVFFYIMLTN